MFSLDETCMSSLTTDGNVTSIDASIFMFINIDFTDPAVTYKIILINNT